MKPKHVLLHIGLHKTGTTSIQGALKSLSDELESFGISYLRTGFGETTKEFLGHHNLSWQLIGDKRFRPQAGDWKSAVTYMQRSNFDKFIISSEGFEYCTRDQIEEIHSFLSQFRVTIILYLRNQVDVLQSVYLDDGEQFVLTNPDQFALTEMSKRRYQYYELICDWISVFGENLLKIRTFEKEKSNLLDPIFKHFDLDAESFNINFPRNNPSKSGKYIALNRALSKLASNYIDAQTYNVELAPIFSQIANRMGWMRNREDVIAQETADSLFEYFKPQNEKINQSYIDLPSEYLRRPTVSPVRDELSSEEILDFMLQACIQQRITMHESRAYLLDKFKKPGRAAETRKKVDALGAKLAGSPQFKAKNNSSQPL